MDMGHHGEVSDQVRRVEMLAMSGAMERARREAEVVRAAITEAQDNGVTPPSEANRLCARLQVAMQRLEETPRPAVRKKVGH